MWAFLFGETSSTRFNALSTIAAARFRIIKRGETYGKIRDCSNFQLSAETQSETEKIPALVLVVSQDVFHHAATRDFLRHCRFARGDERHLRPVVENRARCQFDDKSH